MSVAKAFFDTNVLLYMHGGTDPEKTRRAQELFRDCLRSGAVLLSTQVVQEFYAAGSRKLGATRSEMRRAVATLLDMPLITIGPAQIHSAMDAEERYQISFWDALILAAAQSAGAEVLYTENLNHGQRYGEVLVRNPFRES